MAPNRLSHRDVKTFGSVTDSAADAGNFTSRLGQNNHCTEIIQSEVLDKQNTLNTLNINRINRYRQEYLQGAAVTFDHTKNSTTKNSIFGQFGTLADQSISINSTGSKGGAFTQRDSLSLK